MSGSTESIVTQEIKGISAYIEQQLSMGWAARQPCWDALCGSVTTMIKESRGPLSPAGAAQILKVLKESAFRDHEKNLIAASIQERINCGGERDVAKSMGTHDKQSWLNRDPITLLR